MKRLLTVFFLVAGCAVAQRYYTQLNIVPSTQPVWIYITTNWAFVQAPPIQCDCIITDLFDLHCDPYTGTCYGSTEQRFTAVNPSATFEIGTNQPCSEAVSVSGESYLASIPDLSYMTPLPGIGSWIKLEWLYVDPTIGILTAYMRRDQWESYCDHHVIEISPATALAPC